MEDRLNSRGKAVRTSKDLFGDDNEVSEEKEEEEQVDYTPGSYIVAHYGESWYLGIILDKEKEMGADKNENYIYASYMDRMGVNTFK